MLLLDDEDELPPDPDEAEVHLAARLVSGELQRIDENLVTHTADRWLKVSRVVADAIRAGGFDFADESVVKLHVRRVRALIEAGTLGGQGDLLRPRWSEVRRSPSGGR